MSELVWVALVMVAWIVGVYLGKWDGRVAVRREAIDNCVAHWRIDPATGIRCFVWGGPPPRTSNPRGDEDGNGD